MIILAVLLAGASAPAAAAMPLAERLPDVATRFCVDLISRRVPMPAVGDEETRVFARYGLTPGIPNAAMQALGSASTALIARATLASGEASDGAFAVALGGAAGETCRIIVYRAPVDRLFVQASVEAMKRPGRNWRTAPIPPQSPGLLRLSMIKRDEAKAPFIANVTAPVAGTGPIAMVINIAAVPSTVVLPQGF